MHDALLQLWLTKWGRIWLLLVNFSPTCRYIYIYGAMYGLMDTSSQTLCVFFWKGNLSTKISSTSDFLAAWLFPANEDGAYMCLPRIRHAFPRPVNARYHHLTQLMNSSYGGHKSVYSVKEPGRVCYSIGDAEYRLIHFSGLQGKNHAVIFSLILGWETCIFTWVHAVQCILICAWFSAGQPELSNICTRTSLHTQTLFGCTD